MGAARVTVIVTVSFAYFKIHFNITLSSDLRFKLTILLFRHVRKIAKINC